MCARGRDLADYERLRLPALGARVRAGVVWDIVRTRALRLSRVGVDVSSGGSLAAMGIPKNWCSTASMD